MSYKITTKKILILIIILIVGIEGAYLLFSKESSKVGAETIMENVMEGGENSRKMDSGALRRNLEERINNVGARQTYKEFKNAFKNYDSGINHAAAHVMGDLLFVTQGIDGLTVCDETFAFGCYHSFFGRALTEMGLNAIEKLDKVCVEQYGPLGTGCQHGIGHGILEYFGSNKLPEALKACEKTTQLKEYFGCTSGIFMEYNFPTDIQPGNITFNKREVEGKPYAPCNTIVPEQFKKSCYYEQNQWWSHAYGKDLSKNIDLCTNIPEQRHQKSCFLGLGAIAAPSTFYNVNKAIEICENIPSRNNEILCKAGASWGFFADPTQRDKAPKICDTLPKKDRDMCIEKSDLIENEEINQIYENK